MAVPWEVFSGQGVLPHMQDMPHTLLFPYPVEVLQWGDTQDTPVWARPTAPLPVLHGHHTPQPFTRLIRQYLPCLIQVSTINTYTPHPHRPLCLSFVCPHDRESGDVQTIGRTSTSSIALDYRTVSSHHASMTYLNGKFYVRDNGSTNGTQVSFTEPFRIPTPWTNQGLSLRLGKCMVRIQREPTLRKK